LEQVLSLSIAVLGVLIGLMLSRIEGIASSVRYQVVESVKGNDNQAEKILKNTKRDVEKFPWRFVFGVIIIMALISIFPIRISYSYIGSELSFGFWIIGTVLHFIIILASFLISLSIEATLIESANTAIENQMRNGENIEKIEKNPFTRIRSFLQKKICGEKKE